MVFIRVKELKENETNAEITFMHYMPSMLTDDEKIDGIVVEEYQPPIEISEKNPIPYYDTVNKKIVFNYMDVPLTSTQILEQKIAEQEAAILELASIIGGTV